MAAHDRCMNGNRETTPMTSPTRSSAQNAEYTITAATVAGRRLGFSPAFLDCATMRIHPSRFHDGTPAPYHCLDGLSDEVVVHRLPSGRVALAKATLVFGYERGGFFYTRRAASRACEEWAAR